MSGTSMPGELKYWTADEVIECLSFGDDRGFVERELLKAAPGVYNRPVVTMGDYGPEGPVEPDAPGRVEYSMGQVWRKLPDRAKVAIIKAAKDEWGDEDEEEEHRATRPASLSSQMSITKETASKLVPDDITVQRHQRTTPSGGVTTVRRHYRRTLVRRGA